MLKPKYSNAFKKDYKRLKKRKYDIAALKQTVFMLASGVPLPPSYRDHALVGQYVGCRECHIAPDWLLVYEIREQELILYLTRTGSYSDLFV